MDNNSLISPKFLKEELFPLKVELWHRIENYRITIKNILAGKDPRLLLFMGPCSVHNVPAFMTYAEWAKNLHEKYSDVFFLILRSHLEKPRTCSGWKGFLNDPHLNGSFDINFALKQSRKLLRELTNLGIPIALEFVDPLSSYYLEDLVSFSFIGARTVTSPIHRQMASRLSMPVGFKNTLDGTWRHAVHAMKNAMHPQTFLGINEEGKISIVHSAGNPDSVLVLRGGEKHPNYSCKSIESALQTLKMYDCPSRLIIDCSHGNSQKSLDNQIKVFEEIIKQICLSSDKIRGIMIESYIRKGKQPFLGSKPHPEISLTDPCLDLEATQRLLANAKQRLQPLFAGAK